MEKSKEKTTVQRTEKAQFAFDYLKHAGGNTAQLDTMSDEALIGMAELFSDFKQKHDYSVIQAEVVKATEALGKRADMELSDADKLPQIVENALESGVGLKATISEPIHVRTFDSGTLTSYIKVIDLDYTAPERREKRVTMKTLFSDMGDTIFGSVGRIAKHIGQVAKGITGEDKAKTFSVGNGVLIGGDDKLKKRFKGSRIDNTLFNGRNFRVITECKWTPFIPDEK